MNRATSSNAWSVDGSTFRFRGHLGAGLRLGGFVSLRTPGRRYVTGGCGARPINIVTPIMAYFPLIVVFAARYDRRAGIGTVIALMLPYFFTLTVVSTLFFLRVGGSRQPGRGRSP